MMDHLRSEWQAGLGAADLVHEILEQSGYLVGLQATAGTHRTRRA